MEDRTELVDISGMEHPHPPALLAAARAALLQKVVPALEGAPKFQALMIANAIAIAQRALEEGTVPELPHAAELCAAIRAGVHDNDAALAATLAQHNTARCRISSKPSR